METKRLIRYTDFLLFEVDKVNDTIQNSYIFELCNKIAKDLTDYEHDGMGNIFEIVEQAEKMHDETMKQFRLYIATLAH